MSQELDLEDTKEYKAALKVLGDKNLREFLARTDEELKELIVANTLHMQEATIKTKTSSKYVEASETKSVFDKALREDIKPNKIANALASLVIRSRKIQ